MISKILAAMLLALFVYGATIRAEDAVDLNTALTNSFKQAIGEMNTERAKEKAKKDAEVNAKLSFFVEGWIYNQKEKKKEDLNQVIEQNWGDTIILTPPYENFYLRDFSYLQQTKEIVDTASSFDPYRATVVINELLYVEKGPLIAEPRSDYQYTADIALFLILDYNKNAEAWQVLNTKERITDLRKGWPQDMSKRIGSYFIPKS